MRICKLSTYLTSKIILNQSRNLSISENICVKDPYELFNNWFEEAEKELSHQARFMCLSTANKYGIPSARMIVCRDYGKNGFKFLTNRNSRKAKELDENKHAALTFFWPPNRSVKIEGCAQKLCQEEIDSFFKKLSYELQIVNLSSQQGKVIEGRHVLLKKIKELSEKYPSNYVEIPTSLVGYTIKANVMEFYQNKEDNIHDRLRFRKLHPDEKADNKYTQKGMDDWIYEVLAP